MVEIDKVRALLSINEGVRLFPYVDTRGKITVGIGHNLSDDGISTAVLNLLFSEDLVNAQVVLTHAVPGWIHLDEVRQAALLDLAFNLSHRLYGFTQFLIYVNAGKWDMAAGDLAMTTWYQQVGSRGPRVATMLRLGQWPTELQHP